MDALRAQPCEDGSELLHDEARCLFAFVTRNVFEMKTAKFCAIVASLFSLSLPATAAFKYVGSDSLEAVMQRLIVGNRGVCGNIRYSGAGSLAGEKALLADLQQTVPMSSALDHSDVCALFPNAKQVVLGIDRLLVSRNNAGDASCDTEFVQDVPGYDPPRGPAWAEALQLVYGGVDGSGQREACEHPLRADLIRNWSQLWGDSCASGDCKELRFAFRRGDFSGSTKVFRKIIGIDAFCNGGEFEDEDPLRTDCFDSPDVDYCDHDKDSSLGVVQAVVLDHLPWKGRKRCEKGSYAVTFQPRLNDGECPDRAKIGGYLCNYPIDCEGRFGCVNWFDNPSPMDPLMDGRDYNLLRPSLDAPYEPFDLQDEQGRPLATMASLFMHGNCSAGSDSTEQLACFVNRIDCSIGYGAKNQLTAEVQGSEYGDQCGETGVRLNLATKLNGVDYQSPAYPMSRKLYLSTKDVPALGNALNCDAITNVSERALCHCIFLSNPSARQYQRYSLDRSLTFAGFEPLPAGPQLEGCGI